MDGTDKGMSLVQYNTPFQIFTEKDGLNGSVISLEFYKNQFYVAKSQYLHIRNENGTFEKIEGTQGQNWDMIEAHGDLLLANNSGISIIKDKKAMQIAVNINGPGFLSFCAIKNRPDVLLAGSAPGIYLLEYKNSAWKIKHLIKGFTNSAYGIAMDKDNNLWINSVASLYQLKTNQDFDSIVSQKSFNSEHGLPSEYGTAHMLGSGELVFCTEKGVYQYNSSSDRFERHPDFSMLTGKILPFVVEKNGDIWFDELMENRNYEKGYFG